jgi:hypothetical protein
MAGLREECPFITDKRRTFNIGMSYKCANPKAISISTDLFQFGEIKQIDKLWRVGQPLLHLDEQVSPTGDQSDICSIPIEEFKDFGKSGRIKNLKMPESHGLL